MDYEIDFDEGCPHCNHDVTHYRDCNSIHCNDGLIDACDFYSDWVNYMPGEEDIECSDCRGTGTEIWCPNCGAELGYKNEKLIAITKPEIPEKS